jgi:hypothetical protein
MNGPPARLSIEAVDYDQLNYRNRNIAGMSLQNRLTVNIHLRPKKCLLNIYTLPLQLNRLNYNRLKTDAKE